MAALKYYLKMVCHLFFIELSFQESRQESINLMIF